MSATKNSLTTSEDGKTHLAEDEGQIDGLYDDPSGYVTFGIGHLVDKRKSYLIAGAQSDATLKTKLGTKKLGGKSITYLPATLNGTSDLTSIKERAIDVARKAFAKSNYKKEYDKLVSGEKTKVDQLAEAAIKKETDLLGKTAKGVFGDDPKPFEKTVNAKVTGIALTQSEFDALISFTFNVGKSNFSSSTLLKKVNEAKYRTGDAKQRKTAISVVEGEFKKWNKSGGKVLTGLTKRREKEATRFLEDARAELKTVEEQEKKSSSAGKGPAK